MHVCLLHLSMLVGVCVFQGHCASFCSVLYIVWILVLVSIHTHTGVSVLLCTLPMPAFQGAYVSMFTKVLLCICLHICVFPCNYITCQCM